MREFNIPLSQRITLKTPFPCIHFHSSWAKIPWSAQRETWWNGSAPCCLPLSLPNHPTVDLEVCTYWTHKDSTSQRSYCPQFPVSRTATFTLGKHADVVGGKIPGIECQRRYTHTHTQQGISMHTALSFFKYFKVRVVNHCWTVTVERQGAGRARVAVVGLVQQPVDVTGQTSGGANGMVPQDVDYVIQSVQTILHLRLKTPGGQSSKFTKRTLNFKPSCPKQQDSSSSSFSD